ncbi:MAG: hypothetical protein UX97_C0019G0009 [Candidatus Beckwithbacteria bacterium GW2011_GWA2_47_25]|nr:MAG: hypothetical protein UX97_C0019G0009 [Candidatus Beckwithbacteria bacterium GW2011_GWA2_47_25]
MKVSCSGIYEIWIGGEVVRLRARSGDRLVVVVDNVVPNLTVRPAVGQAVIIPVAINGIVIDFPVCNGVGDEKTPIVVVVD